MINTIITAALIYLLPAALFMLVKYIFRFPKEKRWFNILHFPAVILTIITVLSGYSRIVYLIDNIMEVEWIVKLFALLFSRVNPKNVSAVIFLVLSNCFVAVVEFGYLALTYLVIALYDLISKIIRRIKSKEESDSQRAINEVIGKIALQDSVVTGWLVNMIYDFDADPVCVRKNTVVIRQWITVMKHSFVGLYFVVLVLALVRPASAFFAAISGLLSSGLRYTFILPGLVYVLLSQAQSFMLGTENIGSSEDFESDKIAKKKNGQYDELIDSLSKDFDSSLIALFKQPNSSDGAIQSTDITDTQLQRCAPDDRHVLLSMCHSLRIQGIELNEYVIDALVAIISGRSLIINDFFLGSFFPCLAVFLNHHLAIGNKVMVICPDESAVDDIICALDKRFMRINDLSPVWQSANICTARSDLPVDVLVCTDTTLLNENIVRENRELLGEVSLCIMADSYRLYSRNHLVKKVILDRLGRSDTEMRFICFTGEGSASFRDTIAADFNQNIDYFENIKSGNNTCVMVWRSESSIKPQRVFGLENEPYFDIAFCLATSAVSYGLSSVFVVPDNRYPLNTDMEILGYCANENARKDIKKVANAVKCDGSGEFGNEDCAFVAVHDTSYNLANMFELWSRYSGESYTVLNLISPSYMLRDYFASNMLYFFGNPSAIEIFVPYEEGLRESELTALLVRMASDFISESELMSIANRMNLCVERVEDFLSTALEKVLRKKYHGSIYQFFIFEKRTNFYFSEQTSEYRDEYYVKFSGADTLNESDEINKVTKVEFPNGNTEILPIAYGDLMNYYLPGQYHVFCSRPGDAEAKEKNRAEVCRIIGITNNTVTAVPDTRQEFRPDYSQLSQITLSEIEPASAGSSYSDSNYTLERFTAKAVRHITGYYELCGGNELVDNTCWNSIKCDYTIEKNADVLHLLIPGDFESSAGQMTRLLCRMFNELFVSLFPYTRQNVFVCCAECTDWGELPEAEKRIASLDAVLNGVGIEKSDKNNIHLYFVEFSAIEYGMINVIQRDFRKLLKIIVSYLSWANSEGKPCHLFYGLESWPSIFAPEQLETVIEAMGIRPMRTENTDQSFSSQLFVNGGTICNFCHGATYLTATKLSDGRCLCPDCEKTTISRKREITSLYKEVRTEMEATYGIKLSRWLMVGFKSAASIKKRLGDRSGGRVLGFYQPKLRTLWVERGGPRAATKATIIHELTHCWQFENLSDTSDIQLLEGHSVYAEIDLMKRKGDKAYAKSLEQEYLNRDDIYGEGYRKMRGEMTASASDNCFEVMDNQPR